MQVSKDIIKLIQNIERKANYIEDYKGDLQALNKSIDEILSDLSQIITTFEEVYKNLSTIKIKLLNKKLN